MKWQYISGCKRKFDRLAVEFCFPNLQFAWWQKKEDFDFTEEDWEKEAAHEYDLCAQRLIGNLSSVGGPPTVSMGDLNIGVRADLGTARIEMKYHNYSGSARHDMPLEAEYAFVMPITQLAAAFREAAQAIRMTRGSSGAD